MTVLKKLSPAQLNGAVLHILYLIEDSPHPASEVCAALHIGSAYSRPSVRRVLTALRRLEQNHLAQLVSTSPHRWVVTPRGREAWCRVAGTYREFPKPLDLRPPSTPRQWAARVRNWQILQAEGARCNVSNIRNQLACSGQRAGEADIALDALKDLINTLRNPTTPEEPA